MDKSVAKALELYTKASNQGFAVAQFSLERAMEQQSGEDKDTRKAVKLYRKVASQATRTRGYPEIND